MCGIYTLNSGACSWKNSKYNRTVVIRPLTQLAEAGLMPIMLQNTDCLRESYGFTHVCLHSVTSQGETKDGSRRPLFICLGDILTYAFRQRRTASRME